MSLSKESIQKLIKNPTPLSEDILTNVLIPVIKKYQDKVNVGIEDSVSDLLQSFKNEITKSLLDIANWKMIDDPLFIFPNNCKFCYKKGNKILVVIEEAPKTRNLVFSHDLLSLDEIEKNNIPNMSSHTFNLALPYCVSVLVFEDFNFTMMVHAWRNSKLTSLNDFLYAPYLPNIHSNFSVCLGESLNVNHTTIADQSDKIISDFWASEFNSDLSNFWVKKSEFHEIKDITTWAETSAKDPMYGVQMPLNFSESKTLQYILDLFTIHQVNPQDLDIKHALTTYVDKHAEALFHSVLKYMRKTKFEKYYPKSVLDLLNESISTVLLEFEKIISLRNPTVNNICEPSKKMIPLSDFWQ